MTCTGNLGTHIFSNIGRKQVRDAPFESYLSLVSNGDN